MTKLTAREILAKLVAFPTVSSESNLDLVDWVDGYLTKFGIKTERFYDEDRRKAALLAHVGPWEEGGVILSGHSDVVPVEGQTWDSDPFVLTEKEGRLYGRGTTDMKGFDALAIWALVEASKRDLARPLQLALSFDEEVGCLGAPPMIEHLLEVFPKASSVIVGEPSMMRLVLAHKGGIGIATHMRGVEVHSSLLNDGVSAIMEGAKLVDWANRENTRLQSQEPSDVAQRFYPPFTTLHIGKITGGTAHNITAKDCYFTMSIRNVPDDNLMGWKERYLMQVDVLRQEMQARHPQADIFVDESFFVPGLKPEEEGDAASLVRQLTGDNGHEVVSFGTEAGQFQERGYSVVVCGPGDIAIAHQPNESIEISQFEAGNSFMRRLVTHLEG